MESDSASSAPRTDGSAAEDATRDEADAALYWLRGDEGPACRFLAELAGDGRALEFGIGDGRIALPLAKLGVEVSGVDRSAEQIRLLRSKPGGSAIDAIVDDMTSAVVAGRHSLVYTVFNSILNLRTQDDQVRCFANAARHLDEGGAFVVEAAVPDAWADQHSYVRPRRIGRHDVALNVCRYDPVTQIFIENVVELSGSGISSRAHTYRLIWPNEMDLMARLAGLSLSERWGGWHKQTFDGDSTLHVSVYRRQS
jgi:SAM-dependent methyltransferase